MAVAGAAAYRSVATDFTITTSSGDTISMELFKEQSAAFAAASGEKSEGKGVLAFKELSGYDFRYEGNGLDESDMQEIAEAMETIRPMLEEYLAKSGGDLPQPVTPIARQIVEMFPKPETPDETLALKEQLVETFDDLLAEGKVKENNVFEEMKRLLDEILAQIERPELPLYA